MRYFMGFIFVLALSVMGCGEASNTGGDGGDGGAGGVGGASGGVLRILVTNDDGVGAPGVDAVVEALRGDPNNELIVCAPLENQSNSGDQTTTTPPPLEATMATTASGHPATAVDGFPADSVIYALENLYPDAPPHLVLSGLNGGQNVGNVQGLIVNISGTVGAAKTAACAGIAALASSQGQVEEGGTVDFPAGVTEVLAWLEANRAALLAGQVPTENITSINIPSCDGAGEIRGTLQVPLATENPNGHILNGPQDCTSTVNEVPNDVEAFFNGYAVITPVPRNSNGTCDKLN